MSASARWSLVLSAVTHLVATAALAATFTVDSTLDQTDDDIGDGLCHTTAGTCTLRAAVMQAKTSPPGTSVRRLREMLGDVRRTTGGRRCMQKRPRQSPSS